MKDFQNKIRRMQQVQKTNQNKCAICGSFLERTNLNYNLVDLLELWKPIKFSEVIISEHEKQAESTTLYLCKNCEFGIFLPQIIGNANFYDEILNQEPNYYVGDKWEFTYVLNDLKPSDKIIEIGCGSGEFLDSIRDQVALVFGFEVNQYAIEECRNKNINVLTPADDLRQHQNFFDVVISFHVLEHVTDPILYINDLIKWIKPNGKIIISVPNCNGPVKYLKNNPSNLPPHHATYWTKKSFILLAKKLNLSIKKIKFEPLCKRDIYYYSEIVASSFTKKAIIKKLIDKALRLLFKLFKPFGFNNIDFIKGQSIYIIFQKR
jgi:2-polyprenyl-3-methyl-5-hydroxy-6-metoxy-1,4-benzoquinol methylase